MKPFTPPDTLPRLAPTEGEIEALARELARAEAPQFGPVPPWFGYRARAERIILEARALRASGVRA